MASSLLPDWLRGADEDNSGFLLALLLFAGFYYMKYRKEKAPPQLQAPTAPASPPPEGTDQYRQK